MILNFAVLMASINSSGDATIGEMLTLICSITRAQDISGSVTVQWIGPEGSPVVNSDSVQVGTPLMTGRTTSLSLQFTSLFTSHGGEYTCQADLASQNMMYTISALQDVIIRGTCIAILVL